jgi:hypothetical protein
MGKYIYLFLVKELKNEKGILGMGRRFNLGFYSLAFVLFGE